MHPAFRSHSPRAHRGLRSRRCSRAASSKDGKRESEAKDTTVKAQDNAVQKKAAKSSLEFINNHQRSWFAEMYTDMIRMDGISAAAYVAAILGLNAVFFTILYWLHASGFELNSRENSTPGIVDLFFYSLANTSTLGESDVHCVTRFALLLANFQAITVQMVLVFVTGVFFTRLTQVKPDIRASKYIIFSRFQGRPCLMARYVFNNPKEILVDVRMNLTYKRHVKIEGGQKFFKYDNLTLMRDEAVRQRVAQSLIHFIDDDSPLKGMNIEDLKNSGAAFDISVFASEAYSMQGVFYVRTYEAKKDEILYNVEYRDMIYTTANGRRVVDHANLDVVEELKSKLP